MNTAICQDELILGRRVLITARMSWHREEWLDWHFGKVLLGWANIGKTSHYCHDELIPGTITEYCQDELILGRIINTVRMSGYC
jgi:hypothetical protein